MAERVGAEWHVDRRFPGDQWYHPEVVLHRDSLLWSYEGGPQEPINGAVKRVPLGEFAGLCDAPDAAILDFAQHWGVLAICVHGKHTRHGPVNRPSMTTGLFAACKLLRAATGEYREPLDVWRTYSRRAQAVLKIAARLHLGEHGAAEEWHALDYPNWEDGKSRYPEPNEPWSLEEERAFIGYEVTAWLHEGGVMPVLAWPATGPTLRFGAGTLFAALAVQMFWTVSRTSSFALCSACGVAFLPKRRPNPNRHAYCQKCGRKASGRDAQRRCRAKVTQRVQ
jgi:hypothetical protein